MIYSTTLTETRMRRATLRSGFDVAEVERWKAEAERRRLPAVRDPE